MVQTQRFDGVNHARGVPGRAIDQQFLSGCIYWYFWWKNSKTMKKSLISFFVGISIVAFAQADAPVRSSVVKINGHEFALPVGCVQLEDKHYRFRCLLPTGEDVALGVDEGSNFEKIINSPNDKEGVLDRTVQKTSYGYYVKYLSRKSGNQYNFIYLKDKKITVFGGDFGLVYFFSMIINGDR